MKIPKTFLETILSMKKIIEDNNEPDGKYSINMFLKHDIIEYSSDSTDDLFVRDTKRGDHVTRFGHFVPNVRNVVWAERFADKETNQLAVTTGLKTILLAGECVCLVKDISDIPDQPHLVPDAYVMIPEGYMGFAQPANDKGLGYVVVVKNIN